MSDTVLITMFTHAKRATVAADTTAAFQALGLTIHHTQVQHEPPKQARNRLNAWAAIKHTAERIAPQHENTRGILVIEDDIEPAHTLPDWLAYLAATQTTPTALYTPTQPRWYPNTHKHQRYATGKGKPPPSTIHHIHPLQAGWWGSQAIYLPLPWATRIKNDPRMQHHEHSLGPWDHALRTILHERHTTLGITIPNVIQHRHQRNLVNPRKQPHTSSTYDPNAPAPQVPQNPHHTQETEEQVPKLPHYKQGEEPTAPE